MDLGALAGGLGSSPLDREAYPPRTHCRCWYTVFGVWFRRVAWWAPYRIQWLYPRVPLGDAAPKGISGRTSYLRVRLVFCSSAQLIPQVFNPGGFGPP